MEILYSWEFDDTKSRWTYWYIIALSIIIWIVIWGFVTWQYWMSLLILLVSGLFYYIENNSDDIVKIIVTDTWIQVWKKFFEYTKIEKFGFIFNWENPFILRLYLLNALPLRNLDLNINKENYYTLKDILPWFLTQDEKLKLTVTDKITNKLKL